MPLLIEAEQLELGPTANLPHRFNLINVEEKRAAVGDRVPRDFLGRPPLDLEFVNEESLAVAALVVDLHHNDVTLETM